jgi:hypothetical protein
MEAEEPIEEPVRLETIAAGSASELFDISLEKVLANIADPNTEAESKRTITVKVVFRPTKMRESAEVTVEVTEKLAPLKPQDALLFVGRSRGRHVAVEHDPRQTRMFNDEEKPGLVSVPSHKESK